MRVRVGVRVAQAEQLRHFEGDWARERGFSNGNDSCFA